MRSRELIILVALGVLLLTPGCALVNLLVPLPTPTPVPQRVLRPTFTPTAVALVEAVEGEQVAGTAQSLEPTPPSEQAPVDSAAPAQVPATATEQPPAPTPTATSTPTPYVVVQVQGARARSGPGTDYEQRGELNQGDQLELLARNEDGTWWQVCCLDDQPIWLFGELSQVEGALDGVALAQNVPSPPTPTPTPEPKPAAVVRNALVNVRSGPGTSFSILGQVRQGARLEVVGRNQEATWWQVCCVNGQEGWITDQLVGTEGPIDQVALAPSLPTATPQPTPSQAARAAAVPTSTATPPLDSYAFQLEESTSFSFAGNDYFRVSAKVSDGENNPLDGAYLRVRNETSGQEWLSRQSGGRAWEYSAPNAGFGDFREINVQYDTNGQSVLAGQSFLVWLVDGSGQQVSPAIRYEQEGDEFQWLYVVFVRR